MKMTGAQILIETLIEQGVEVIFGFPGGAVLNIYDALYKNRHRIRHVLTSHEQGAAHAADGYARVTGKPGVVFATSGPGATNLVTGIATAYMDSVPMVAITGNVPLDLIGRDSFQEIDIAGITMPITKHNYIVNDVNKLEDIVREAFCIAKSGRPGPVLIDIPKDITAKQAEFKPAGPVPLRQFPRPAAEKIKQAARMIEAAKRPLVYAGGGVVLSGAAGELEAFLERVNAPAALSLMGITALPYDCPKNLGLIGMHGTPVANKATADCDLLITIGARFSDRVAGDRNGFAGGAKIIHIDADASEHGKNVRVDLPILGDAKETLRLLLAEVGQQQHKEWLHTLLEYKVHNPMAQPMDGQKLNIRDVLSEISAVVGEDAIIVTDVGQHQMITAQYYKFKKSGSFLSSGGLGTMGYGMGAAIGAKIAAPDRPVVLVTGDGCFHMNMNELACAVSENLPILIVVMNNGVLGMVRQWQRLFYNGRYANTTLHRRTDFVKVAEALGAAGYTLKRKDRIRPVLQQAFAQGKPCVVDCVVDKDDSVFPLIPPGGSGKDMIFCD